MKDPLRINRRSHFSTRLLAITAIAFTCLLSQLAANQRASENQRFASELRTRRLFDLAETHCRNSLEREQLTPRDKAMLTIELIRIQVDRAYQAKPQDQAKHWQVANQIADEFLNTNPGHPFVRIVQAQQALTDLSRAILIRQSIQAGSTSASAEESLQQLRKCGGALESIEKSIGNDLLNVRQETRFDEGLNEQQLLSLRNNIQFHIAETYMNRAMLHDDDEQLNRIDALNRVREQLDRLQQSVDSSDPLWGKLLINRLQCLRLQKDHAELDRALQNVSGLQGQLSPSLLMQVEAEQLRAAIDRNEPDQLKRLMIDKAILSDSPELSLARIEAVLKLASAESEPENAGGYQRVAVALADQLEKRHGRYWSNRAGSLLISVASSSSHNVDVDLLSRLADATYLKGDYENAIKVYESAAKQANDKGDSDRNFKLLYKAAIIQHHRRLFQDAANRLKDVASGNPTHEDAAQAHLLAIVNTSQLARSDPKLLDEYLQMLREQITTWPAEESTDQARIWLAAFLAHNNDFTMAIETLLQVPIESKFFIEAIRAAGTNAEKSITGNLDDATLKQQRERTGLLFASIYRNAFAQSDKNRTESDWWGMTVSATVLSRLNYSIRNSDKETLLAGLSLEEPLPWELAVSIRSLLTFEFAKESEETKFEQVAKQLVESSPQQAMIVVQRILDTRKLSPQIAAKLPDVIQQLKANESELNESSKSVLLTLNARVAAAAGDEQRAIDLFEELLNKKPRDLAIRIEYASLLTQSADADVLNQGLAQWRTIARATEPRSREWYQAKYNVAYSLHKTGKSKQANEMLVYLKEIPPGWEKSELKDAFDILLKSTE